MCTTIPPPSPTTQRSIMSGGKLILVPSPIGNLDDISLRAIKVLRSVEGILCEDTRHSGKLLKHHEIENRLHPFHQHNEHKVTERWVEYLKGGAELALMTDAGTPGISDPGYLLVHAAIEAGVQVEVLPGATAFVPAVVASGLSCERFLYLGFPPQKKGRQTFWKELIEQPYTMVMYESPHRINKALKEAIEVLGADRMAAVVRELSKLHESYHRGTLNELLELGEHQGYKGEIVLVIEGDRQYQKRLKAETI
jgi:16S rRNA (cytidine1402-2'-O)-methyltransferase